MATNGCVLPVRLPTSCTARRDVGNSCACSCARSTDRHVAGLISRTCRRSWLCSERRAKGRIVDACRQPALHCTSESL